MVQCKISNSMSGKMTFFLKDIPNIVKLRFLVVTKILWKSSIQTPTGWTDYVLQLELAWEQGEFKQKLLVCFIRTGSVGLWEKHKFPRMWPNAGLQNPWIILNFFRNFTTIVLNGEWMLPNILQMRISTFDTE